MTHEIKKVDINLLTPREGNPNVLDGKGFNFLVKEIKKRGMVQPILVDKDYVIIDGEHRWRACKQIGTIKEVDIVMVDADKAEAMIALINMNQIKGDFDPTKLGLMIESLIDEKGKAELEQLLALERSMIEGLVKEAEADQVKKKKSGVFENFTPETDSSEFSKFPVSAGEIWACGQHRVMCGDASNPSDVRKLFADADVTSCVFSLVHPPSLPDEVLDASISNVFDICNTCLVIPKREEVYAHMGVMNSYCVWYLGIWSYLDAVLETGNLLSTQSLFTPILYGVKEMQGEEYTPPVLNDALVSPLSDAFMEKGIYADALPKDLVSDILRLFSNRGDIVYEPFLGSGTSLISAQMVKRTIYGMELDPRICNMALSRWSRMVGKDPVKVE